MGILARAAKSTIVLGGSGFDQGPMWNWFGMGSKAVSGVSVTHGRAMKLAAYQTAVRVVSEDVSGVPLILYRREAGGGRERAVEHPSWTMLHDAANPEMTSFTFRETLQGHLLGWGNGYAEKVRNGTGQVVQLWPLRPDRTELLLDDETGRLFYRVTLRSGETRDLRRRDVFHVPGLGFDGLVGYPVLSYMTSEVLGLAIAQQEYVGRYYANDARPGVYLRAPGKLSDEAAKRLKARWDEAHAGLTNAHRTAVLEDGVDIATIGVSPVEQQLLDSRKWSATEIGAMFRLAPWKVGVYDRATWANVEDGNIDHWQSALRAWFVRWEQQLNLQVVGLDTGHLAEHLIDGILRGNAESRARYYWTMRQAGAVTADEIRDRENLNRRGGDADTLLAPQNMAPIDLLRELIAGQSQQQEPPR